MADCYKYSMWKKIGIYILQSPSGKLYIGKTIDFNRRMKNYERMECKKQTKLYHALLKYGYAAFKIDFYPYPEYMLNWIEKSMIRQYNTIKEGYNLTDGGKNGRHSEETKKKISEAIKGDGMCHICDRNNPSVLSKDGRVMGYCRDCRNEKRRIVNGRKFRYDGLCPDCGVNEKDKYSSGKEMGYCRECNNTRKRFYNKKSDRKIYYTERGLHG